ncbi:hypothetical protein B0H10DRAFT_2224324 [Mycena sp. CBHHK59/15]|nr:hypothetical protein B0H10DRAFT_2224324 [Mycena sp. CBHHK59/15]
MSVDTSPTYSTLSKELGTLHVVHRISTTVPRSFPHFFLSLTRALLCSPNSVIRHVLSSLRPEKLKSSDFVDLSGGRKLQVHFGATDKPLRLSYEFATTAPTRAASSTTTSPRRPLHPWPDDRITSIRCVRGYSHPLAESTHPSAVASSSLRRPSEPL